MPFNFPFSYPYFNRFSPQRRYPMSSHRFDNFSKVSGVSGTSSTSRVSSNSNTSNSSNASSSNGQMPPNENNSSNRMAYNEDSSNSHTSSKDDHSSDGKNSNQPLDDRSLSDDGEYLFEIFGLKLFFDDILILCILFFLYNEEVKDYELFLCLILLLIT